MAISYYNAEAPLDLIDTSWVMANGKKFKRYRDAADDKEGVAKLAASIEEAGGTLAQPIITVFMEGRHRLVAGGYRLAAYKLLGRDRIPARVANLEGPWDDDLVRLVEIDENLIRTELDLALRTKLTKERGEIIAKQVKNTARTSGGIKGSAKKTTTGERELVRLTGRSKGAVGADIRRGEKIDGDVLDSVAHTKLSKGVVLDKLAELPPEVQAEVIAPLADFKRKQRKLGVEHINNIEVKPDGTKIGIGIGAKGTKANIPRQPQATITEHEARKAKEAADKAAAETETAKRLKEAADKAKAKALAEKPKEIKLANSKIALDNLRKVPADIKRFFGGIHPDHKQEALAILGRIAGTVKLLNVGDANDSGTEGE
jgi:ParB-like chromosome segregation protein Spo0J